MRVAVYHRLRFDGVVFVYGACYAAIGAEMGLEPIGSQLAGRSL